ncbi:MAG: metallophosphoesterase [Lachnospiraceae bacterium]|nr:metallophosphoesterase [Lachnospiraceae bacterium]
MKNKGLLFLCSFFSAFFTGVILSDIHNIKVRHHVIYDGRIKKNMRVVALSDLHGRSFGRGNEKLIKKICDLKPDAVFTAGDIMTAKDLGVDLSYSVDVAEDLLKELAKRFPVYFGMGNHESRVDWMPWLFDFTYEDMMKRFADTGAKILDNDSITLDEYGIKICGLNMQPKYYLHKKPAFLSVHDLNALVGKPDKNCFNVLLAHDPEYLPAYAAWGADLSISGHYHGGIMRLPLLGGVISPKPRLFPDYSGGMFRLKGAHQLVLCGLGVHTLPVRVFNPAELVVLDLKKGRKD